MKKVFAATCLLFALGFCANSMAADDTKKDKKDMKHDLPADGTTLTITGMMAVKATDAKGDVICRLTTGKNKNDTMYNLVAKGEIAKQIEALRQEGDKVKVSGVYSGGNLTVDKIEKVVYMKK